jgi:hypothetical protein
VIEGPVGGDTLRSDRFSASVVSIEEGPLTVIRLAALAAALAAAFPAAAQRATAPSSRGSRGATPAPAPATHAPPAAPLAAAEPSASLEAPAPEWRIGSGLGYELGLGDLEYSGLQFRIEAVRPFKRSSPVTTLSFVGSFSATHASGSEDVPIVVPAFPLPIVRAAKIEWDANVFEVVPGVRLTYSTGQTVSFFADGGAGLVYTATRVYLPSAVGGVSEGDVASDGVGGVVRLAGGLVFNPSPAMRLSVEALGLHLRFGDGPGTAFTLGASLSYRL